MWKPILMEELHNEILKSINLVGEEKLRFWKLIKIFPEKWQEEEYGCEGGGFWVVAISGKRIIWYNDIEGGFNISSFYIYGIISQYTCDQYELSHAIIQLYQLANFL